MNKKTSSKEYKDIFKRLFTYVSPFRKGLTFAFFLIVLSSLFNSLGPFILGKATDTILSIALREKPIEALTKQFIVILIVLFCCYLLYAIFKYIGSVIVTIVSQRTIASLRRKVDEKFKKVPLNYFDTNSYGDILGRLTNDVDTISNALGQSLEQIVTSITAVITIFIMMMIISPILTFIGIVTVPLALFFSMKIVNYSQTFFQQQQDLMGELNGYVEEMYTGHNLIASYSKEEDTIADFGRINQDLKKTGWKSLFYSSILMPVTQGMTNLGYVFVVVISGLMVIGGQLSVGMIQSFIQYLRQFSSPINQTVQISSILQSTIAAATRIFEFLDETEERLEAMDTKSPDSVTGHVVFSHVTFGYVPHKYLMKDVSLEVLAGSKVAIVGPTGAGKTTLVNLLLRFYEINAGEISIDGINITQMKRTTLREIYGMVLQDTWLFTGTIKENIRYGRLNATDQEVIDAAKAANADMFIKMLPNGYDFKLSEGAQNIAQGERQLLTIARAILSQSPIMILDEATSSVDTRTELLIQQALQNLMKGRTSFVIAHRLSTILDADMIIYMENGDIKETGSHSALLEKDGYYASLYRSQFAEK